MMDSASYCTRIIRPRRRIDPARAAVAPRAKSPEPAAQPARDSEKPDEAT